MATALKVTVAPERISLRPGESADVELTVQNASQVVEHFTATVVGLPSNDLFTCEPDVVKLRPREVGTLRMKISVPERGGLVAGPYTLGLVVKSPYSQDVSRCEELPLDVQPAPSLNVSVQPEVATGGKVAHYGVSLSNEGNMPMAVTFSGTDPENRVGFRFEPKELRLEPGMAAGANLVVNSDPPLTGQEIRRSITIRAHAGETTVDKPLTFVQRPRIKGGMMKFGALAAGLAVLGGMTYGGAKLLRDLKTTNAAATSALQPPVNPTQGGGGGQNGQNGQNGQQSQPPSQPPSQSAGQPSAPASQPPSAPSGPPGAPQAVAVTDNIDFTIDTKTQQPVADNEFIEDDHYAARGLRLANLTEKAPLECKNATKQAIKINRAGTTIPVAGVGAYLTTVKPAEIRDCNIVPVRMTFDTALTAVNIWFAGLPDVEYTATANFADGTTASAKALGAGVTNLVPLGFQAAKDKPIKSVDFAVSPQIQLSNKSLIMLKKVGYTRIPA